MKSEAIFARAPLLIARIYYGLRNLIMDVRYGAPLFGVKDAEVKGHASVVNSDYSLYPHVFSRVEFGSQDVIVDVGAGRGRFINWVISMRTGAQVIGIEYDPETAERTARRLSAYRNVRIIKGDATVLMPENSTIFFMFNPFGETLMRRFRDEFERVFKGRPSPLLVYLRPLEISVFRESPRWSVAEYEIPLERLDARYAAQPSHRCYALLRLRDEGASVAG